MKYPKIPYWFLLLGPYILFAIGYLSNALAMAANDAQMPVLYPQGCEQMEKTMSANNAVADLMGGDRDTTHVCMTKSTHLKILSDWIVTSDGYVASPGDFLIFAFDDTKYYSILIWIVLVSKDLFDADSKTN